MSVIRPIRRLGTDLAVAFQFLTRIPMPAIGFEEDSLSRAVKFFPLVGVVVAAGAILLQGLLISHLGRPLVALIVLVYFVLITGCFHEDGLADTADGIGGGWNRDQMLLIMKDSRIGSYGAAALTLSLLARFLLLGALPLRGFAAYVISAQVLCRWSSLPLSYFLPPAREQDGQGARIAGLTSMSSLIVGTILQLRDCWVYSAAYSRRSACGCPDRSCVERVVLHEEDPGGVTGDCFGASNQLTEIAIYFCGVWGV